MSVSQPVNAPGFGVRVSAIKAREIATTAFDPRIASVHVSRNFETHIFQSAPYIGAPNWWPYEAPGQIINVIDSGISNSHPFLLGDVVHEACFKDPAYGVQCPNANASGDSPYPTPGSGQPHTGSWSGVNNPSHGTHVAGIAAGQSGVARGAKVMAINIFTYDNATNHLVIGEDDFYRAMATMADLTPWNSIVTVNVSIGLGGFASDC